MKNVLAVGFVLSLFLLFACNKNDVHNTADKVGISRVTHYATFQMTGSNYMSVVQGGSFTDPGIKAFENGSEIPVKTSGSVNTNSVGLYTITYSATNKDSFTSTATRTVVVIPSHEAPGTDLSGKYNYVGSSSYTATITKVAEGTYTTNNAWSGATVIPLVFISVNGTDIIVPDQTSSFGPLNGSGTYAPATGLLVYSLNLPNYGISDSHRTWQRQ